MSVIDSIELFFVEIPLPAPFSAAWLPGITRTTSSYLVIRLGTDDGVFGYSTFPSAARERAGMGDALVQLFMGKDATDIDRVQEMLRIPAYGGIRNFWVEPAFWDIKGKLANKPVYELLGGAPSHLKLYASAGELMEPAQRIEEAHARLEEGFTAMKLRVHSFDEAIDIRDVQQPARALEGKMNFSVDCNQAFRIFSSAVGPRWDLPRAKRFCDACHEAGLLWVEEPLFMEMYDELAELTSYARIPVSGGELQTSGLPELSVMIEKRCYDVFQPDAIWTGGIAQTLAAARLARAAGLQFTSHTWSNGIGFAVNLQVMLASGFADEMLFEYPIVEPSFMPTTRDILLTEPWTHERGVLPPPTLPGLGFEIDTEALARFGRCFFRANRRAVYWMPEVLRSYAPALSPGPAPACDGNPS